MDYVNVPILANFHVAQGLAVKVGIQPGFLINDKVEVSANGVSSEIGLKESYRAVGIDAVTNAISVLGESTKHSVFQITLGYKFSL